jgi:tetratricopeptide (TPR) repeat protein
MRQYFIFLFCCFSLHFYAQEHQLAYQYYRNGDYEKAVTMFKPLHEQNPYNTTYTNYLIDCFQQLAQYENAIEVINNQLNNFPNQDYLYVNLGYNYQLQHQQTEADFYYNKAIEGIENSPNLGYLVGKNFQDNHLLDYALLAYKKAMEVNKSANYNMQIAQIYGEKGEVTNMFNTYLDMVEANDNYLPSIKNYIGKYLTNDPENENNILLKKQLLKRSQNNPQNSWNELLSWLYLQQKEYEKALVQEKALYKRNNTNLNAIVTIGKLAFDDNNYQSSKNCFNYTLENTVDLDTELTAKLYLLQIDIETNASVDIIENQFQNLFESYGKNSSTLNIQVIYAEFLAYTKNDPTQAISVLKETLKLPLNEFQKGYVKTKLADILVFENQFNTALIYYTQVQNSLENHEIAQTARFKIAQTSYFKGDFEWSQSQLKVLKNSTSQLISNDALSLNLLITDNIVKDSLKIALKKYAKADLLSFQNKNQQAIDTLQTILTAYKGHPIEDETLFKQAQLYEKTNDYEKAENNYLAIIALNSTDILADDATYYLAELYLNKLNNPEKAATYYQQIIFEYPSSIYLVDARKKYRKLRGDEIY